MKKLLFTGENPDLLLLYFMNCYLTQFIPQMLCRNICPNPPTPFLCALAHPQPEAFHLSTLNKNYINLSSKEQTKVSDKINRIE